ncbi:MAG: Dps family protein [Desulfuromonadaceae bacterium]
MTTTEHLKRVLADELVFSIQMQSFHWNVRGMLFSQLHEFFGDIYAGAYGAVDPLAEYIRTKGDLAPCCLADIYASGSVKDLTYVPGTAQEMLQYALVMNQEVIASVNLLSASVDPTSEAGILDYAATLNDMHTKWDWMLKAHLG